jgi:hypothetical protein
MLLVRAELAAVAEDSAAAGGNESFGIFLLAAARKPGPRRAWPGSGARVDLAPGRHGGRPGRPARRHPVVAGGASRSARACLAGARLIARRLDSPRQVGRSCIRPWAAGQPCPVPGRPRRPARRAAGRAEVAAQGPRRRRGIPGAHAGQGIRPGLHAGATRCPVRGDQRPGATGHSAGKLSGTTATAGM